MKLYEAKKIVKEKAKEVFGNIKEDKWTIRTHEWADGSFCVEYFNGEGLVVLRRRVTLQYCRDKWLKVDEGYVAYGEHFTEGKLYSYEVLK